MTSINVVFAGPETETRPIRAEKPIASGETLYPGYLVEDNGSGEWQAHSTAGTGADMAVIDLNGAKQTGASNVWTAGDDAQAFYPAEGQSFALVLAASQTITVGEALTSNGDGTVKSATITGATPDAVLFVASEAVTTSGSTARILARRVSSGVKATA